MTIAAGTRFGPYQIGEQLGAGGMGEVYRARDTRLDRIVAVKVVPKHLSDVAERRERFEREARAISSLNHPNICTLHDIGRQDGIDFLVMEFLDGETLESRLERGPLPLAEALEVAAQISDALDKAHRQGVVHRDLKPGNVMLTKSGAKLLDFGLAKQAQPAFSASSAVQSAYPTVQSHLTAAGTIVGTLQYMAPEQLEGKDADARTDVFAFGSMLHEMVTGKKAFEGKSQVSLIAAILDHDPPSVSSLQPVSPPLLDHLVRTCLAKNPDKRWQSMADVLIQLQLIRGSSANVAATEIAGGAKRRLRIAWGAAAVLLALSIGLAFALMSPRAVPAPAKVVFEIPTPNAPSPVQAAISPDGSHVVSIMTSDTNTMLWVRALDNVQANFITGTTDPGWPFWSPDGRSIAFFSDGKLKKVDLLGGPPQILCDGGGAGGTWNRDNVIVFAQGGNAPLYKVSAAGGSSGPVDRIGSLTL